MPFIANTPEQRRQMLAELGLSPADLFADIPPELACKGLNLPDGLDEPGVRRKLAELGNANTLPAMSFLGAGFYDHFIPAAVDALISRSEFYTAYTPYQPEISQGTLQAIYEYQSAMCRLTAMEVGNASLYDGGTAVFEAATMALRITGRSKVVVDEGVHPVYRRMLACYSANLGVRIVTVPLRDARADRQALAAAVDAETAALIVANPNFLGAVDDLTDLAQLAHDRGAVLSVSVYPLSLGILKPPGAMGADIVTGEGQSLGLPLSFGGPYLGVMTTRLAHARKMPGRIVGRTVDHQGRQGFVLTLQAREQHIRREKATSNICSNEGLCALTSLVYLSLMGKQGLPGVARLCAAKAQYAKSVLSGVRGVSLRWPDVPTFNEFVLELPRPASDVAAQLLHKSIAAGYPLGADYPDLDRCLLVAVTEKNTRHEIDALAKALEDVL